MKVFISWSGPQSGHIARALRDWLPNVIQTLEPWMSAEDIDAGSRWNQEMADQLDATDFGILCITRANPEHPWLVYEAGALSKSVGRSRVVPYCIGLNPTDIPNGPLTQFQGKIAERDPTFEMVRSINNAMGGSGLSADRLQGAFDAWWPTLKESLSDLPEDEPSEVPTTEDKMDEILMKVRSLDHQFGSITTLGSLTPQHYRHLEDLIRELESRRSVCSSALSTLEGRLEDYGFDIDGRDELVARSERLREQLTDLDRQIAEYTHLFRQDALRQMREQNLTSPRWG